MKNPRKCALLSSKTVILILVLMALGSARGQAVYSLDECIRLALKNNRDVRIAGLQVRSASADMKGSLANILPTLNYSAGSFQQGSYYSPQFGFSIPKSLYYSAGFSLSQNIFDGGKWWNQVAAGRNSYQTSVKSELNARVTLVLNVKEAFYQYLKDVELLEVGRRQVEVAEQQVERVQHQYEVEQVAKSDLLKQKVFLGDMKVQYLNQQAAVRNSFNQLANVMGMELGADFSVVDSGEPSPPMGEYHDLWEMLKDNNPALLAKRTEIEGAQLRVKIARSSYLPSLSASLSYDGFSDDFNQLYSDVDKTWRRQLRFTISYPLFTGFAQSSEVERSRVEQRIVQEEYENLVRNLKVQFDSVLENLTNVRETIPIYRESKESAEEDLRLAQERYNLGAATILDVLDAQLSVASANSSLVRATYDEKILRAQLDALTGKL